MVRNQQPVLEHELLCAHCRLPFKVRGGNVRRARFCGSKCSREYHFNTPNSGVKPSLRGGLSEITAVANLIRKGFDVYRAVCDHGPCDLIATRGPEVLRIEVTSGRQSKDGAIHYPSHKSEQYVFDVIAVVLDTDEVHYFNKAGAEVEFSTLPATP